MRNKFWMFTWLILMMVMAVTGCRPEYGIEFDTEVIDFGTINSGESRELVFTFHNTGREVLKIWEIRPTCGCTEPNDWDQEIPPGGSGEIKINFHTQAYREDIKKVIYIRTNVPNRASVQLTVMGYIYHALEISSHGVYIGDILEQTKPVTRSFFIKNNQGTPLLPSQIVMPDENTTFELIKLNEEREYELKFTVHPPFIKEEDVVKAIVIKAAGENKEDVVLTFSYFVPPPIQVNPKEIALDMVKVGYEKISWRINIRSNITKPIAVRELQFDGTGADVFIDELHKDKFYQVAVVFPEGFTFPENQPTFHVSFKVKNDPRGLLYTIPISAKEE